MGEYDYLWGGGSTSTMAGYNAGNFTTTPATTSASGMGQFGMAMQVGGAVSSVVGSYFALQGQKSLLNAQADIDEINARMSEAAARSALLSGQRQEEASQMRTAQIGGAQRAAQAANGIDLGVGSAAEVRASTKIVGEIDADTIHANAVRTAWGYRTQTTNFQNDAIERRGMAGAISPGMGAAASLMGSAGNVAQSWYRYQQMGLLPSTNLTTQS